MNNGYGEGAGPRLRDFIGTTAAKKTKKKRPLPFLFSQLAPDLSLFVSTEGGIDTLPSTPEGRGAEHRTLTRLAKIENHTTIKLLLLFSS